MGRKMRKAFVIPSELSLMRVPGQVPTSTKRESGRVERAFAKPKMPTETDLQRDTSPRLTAGSVVAGLGFDKGLAENYRKFLDERAGASINETRYRQEVLQKMHDDKLQGDLRRVLADRAVTYYRSRQKLAKKAMLTLDDLQKAEPRGGRYYRRITTEKGDHRYYYDPDQYHRRADAHIAGADVLKKRQEAVMAEKSQEKIPGGLASGKSPSDFDLTALADGVKVEMEHTNNKAVAREIAMDHLTEDPAYYRKLKTIEKEKPVKKSDDDVEKAELTPEKARQILHDKEVHGHPLTEQQRKYFGAVASGTARKSMDSIAELGEFGDELRKGEIEPAIRNLLRANPTPDDETVHKLAERIGAEVDDVEEAIYKIAGKTVKKGEQSSPVGENRVPTMRPGGPDKSHAELVAKGKPGMSSPKMANPNPSDHGTSGYSEPSKGKAPGKTVTWVGPKTEKSMSAPEDPMIKAQSVCEIEVGELSRTIEEAPARRKRLEEAFDASIKGNGGLDPDADGENEPRGELSKGLDGWLQKSSEGEGSRGGHIIGHTVSGKPIYAVGHSSYATARETHKWSHQERGNLLRTKFPDYNSTDHFLAGEAHKDKEDSEKDRAKKTEHYLVSQAHYAAADAMDHAAAHPATGGIHAKRREALVGNPLILAEAADKHGEAISLKPSNPESYYHEPERVAAERKVELQQLKEAGYHVEDTAEKTIVRHPGHVKKSLEDTMELDKWLSKAEISSDLPAGEPGYSTGVEVSKRQDGGKIAGVGQHEGDGSDGGEGRVGSSRPGPSLGTPNAGVSAGEREKLSEDDADPDKQMTDHEKPIERLARSFDESYRVIPEDFVEGQRRHAQQMSQLRKSHDVYIPPTRVERAEPLQKSDDGETFTVGRGDPQGVNVTYSDHLDRYIEKAIQGPEADTFYPHGRPTIGALGNLRKGESCEACGLQKSQALTACPHCGAGTALQDSGVFGGGVLVKSERPGPVLRRAGREAVVLPNGVIVVDDK